MATVNGRRILSHDFKETHLRDRYRPFGMRQFCSPPPPDLMRGGGRECEHSDVRHLA